MSWALVNQAVENAIGHRPVTDLFVLAGHGKLRRENQREDLTPASQISQKSRRSGSDSGAKA